jgi:polysaccharide export outer membrane protein
MFQDLNEELSLTEVPREAPLYSIKPFDNLYVSIKTLDPEVNQLYNPSAEGTGFGGSTSMQYGDRPSQFINGYMVNSEGIIELPILGQIPVAGKVISDAEKMVKEKAQEILKEPNVKVKILNFKVNVLGEVRNPGLYYNYEGKLNIIEAIGLANGITEYANLKKVLLVRQYPGSSKTFNIDLTDRSIYYSDAFYLQSNDLVYIKPHKNKRTRENTTVYSLFLSTISTFLLVASLIITN